MKNWLFLTLFSLFYSFSFAQSSEAPLTMSSGFFGWQFKYGGQKRSLAEVTNMMAPNEQASAYLRSARSNNTLATLVSTIGGFMVGYPIGTSLGGGDPNWLLAGVGAGLIVVSVPLSLKATSQAKNAVATFNEGATATSLRGPELRAGFTGNGIGLRLQF